MGLAGRKQKQRIPADPRNLSWADDASRFGLSYLSKFGWDASQGLGSSGDGMKTHLKVQQKLDMMGIGAQHQLDPNDIAWKQNKEFEALLKRLNESAEQGKAADDEDAEGEGPRVREMVVSKAFVRAREEEVEGKSVKESSVTRKKRKYEDKCDTDANEIARKKQNQEKKEESQKFSSDDHSGLAVDPTSESSSVLSPSKSNSELIPKTRPMAHRARIRAAKRIAGKSASAIAEILGIAPSSSVSTSTSTPAPTPPPTPTPEPSLSLDNMTTSTKSVADYFKEKLLARTSSSSSPSLSSPLSGSATPGLGATGRGPGLFPPDDEGEPRRGLGSRASAVPRLVAGSTSAAGDGNVDSRGVLTEKQRRKAERKAEKQKRLEVEANQAASEGVSTPMKEQIEWDDTKRRTSKREKKQKRRSEREEHVPADQPNDNDDTTEKRQEHDTPSSPLPGPEKKPKKGRKEERS